MTYEADVAVIGAGIAGLGCADRLLASGLRVVVVEGRARVGGRMDTRHPPGWPGPVELGAEFVHGRPPELLSALRRAGAERVTIPDRHFMASGGRLHGAARVWRAAEAALDALSSEDDAPFSVASGRAHAARGADRDTQRLLRGFVEGFNAADADRASARWLKHQQESADESPGLYRVRAGYDRLALAVAARVARRGGTLLLGAVVKTIDWRSKTVVVRAHGALGDLLPIRARAAVVTLPLGVLQAPAGAEAAVRFLPALPAGKRGAIRALEMGSVLKVVLRFRPAKTRRAATPPWPEPPAFIHAPNAAIPTWWRPLPLPPNVVVGWAAGPAADALARAEKTPSGGGSRTLRVAVGSLARALGSGAGELGAALEEGIVVDWRADPFARGAYAWVPAGADSASAALALPVAERLFFAGEATASDSANIGTVHGALETGTRAAKEVLAALTPQARKRPPRG